uniref:Putative pulmonary surfactant-associated protein a n=1 Tax=Panstrongylus lignarius TaxID=156445 RepID=A0A224XVL2_9HEMI
MILCYSRTASFTFLLALISVSLGHGQRAKAVARAKVEGPGFSVLARSAKQCLALCNKQPACDAANYEVSTHKCRIFTRCSPTAILQRSTKHMHFTKRPMINENGYTYHAESDSCLKLMEKVTDFAEADALCRGQNGRLVSLTDPSINKEAAALLKASKAQFAWIGLTDSRLEGNPQLSDGRRVSETKFFPIAEQQARNDTRRNCWALSDSGEWAEHSCKNRTQFSICQIMSY